MIMKRILMTLLLREAKLKQRINICLGIFVHHYTSPVCQRDIRCFHLHNCSAGHRRCVHACLTLVCEKSGSHPGNPVSNANNPLVQVKTRSAFNS